MSIEISTHYVRYLIRALAKSEADIFHILDGVYESSESLMLSSQPISSWQASVIVRNIWTHFNDEFLGCTEKNCPTGTFKLACRRVAGQSDLRHAYTVFLDFYNHVREDVVFSLKENGRTAEIQFVFVNKNDDPINLLTEFWVLTLHRFFFWLAGCNARLLEAKFIIEKPNHIDVINDVCCSPVLFSQPYNAIVFDSALLDRPIIRDFEQINRLLRESPCSFFDLLQINRSVKDKAKVETIALLRKESFNHLRIETVASRLNISEPSLRKELAKEGTTFKKLVAEVRIQHAKELIEKTDFPMADIAELSGFSESASFSRAFKKYFGLNPKEFRKI